MLQARMHARERQRTQTSECCSRSRRQCSLPIHEQTFDVCPHVVMVSRLDVQNKDGYPRRAGIMPVTNRFDAPTRATDQAGFVLLRSFMQPSRRLQEAMASMFGHNADEMCRKVRL